MCTLRVATRVWLCDGGRLVECAHVTRSGVDSSLVARPRGTYPLNATAPNIKDYTFKILLKAKSINIVKVLLN